MTDRTQAAFYALEEFESALQFAADDAFDCLALRGDLSGAARTRRGKEIAKLLTRQFVALCASAPDEVLWTYGVQIGGPDAGKLLAHCPGDLPYPELAALSARTPVGREP